MLCVGLRADPSPRHLSPDALFVRAYGENETSEVEARRGEREERARGKIRDFTDAILVESRVRERERENGEEESRQTTQRRFRYTPSRTSIRAVIPRDKKRVVATSARGLLLIERFLAVSPWPSLPATLIPSTTTCCRWAGLSPGVCMYPWDYPAERRRARAIDDRLRLECNTE